MPLQKGGRERCDGGRGEGNVMVEARGWGDLRKGLLKECRQPPDASTGKET